MSPQEYRAALVTLGLSQSAAGQWFGAHEVTGRRWALRGPPGPVVKLIRLMLALHFSPSYVDMVSGDG